VEDPSLGIRVILVRGIRDAQLAEAGICSAVADLVAMSRALMRELDLIER